jgi:hypothetical protein
MKFVQDNKILGDSNAENAESTQQGVGGRLRFKAGKVKT